MEHDDYTSEGTYISENDIGVEMEYSHEDYIELRNSSPIILSDVSIYEKAKQAKVGERVRCGCGCGNRFVKTSYQQAFFRNKGRNNCKDRYHNRTAGRVERTLERYRKSVD